MSGVGVSNKRYIAIDKDILHNSYLLNFNLYSENKERKLALIYKKNTLLKKEHIQLLVALNSIYVEEREKFLYEEYYKEFIDKKQLSNIMAVSYQDVKESLLHLFEKPESLERIKIVEEKIKEMVVKILENKVTISLFLLALEYNYYTYTHSLNVAVYAICLGKYLGMNATELEILGTSAVLHDIGKSKIDPKILHKEEKLTDEEFEIIKKHPELGWEILKKAGIEDRHILAGVRSHHEKIDGSGYPDKLNENEIHQYAKIIAICDVFDALTTSKSYKNSVDTFSTIVMMKKEMTNHLNSNLLNKFIMMFKEENKL